MHKHQHAMPLIRLLARLGWQRDPDLWTVRCRNHHGRRARLQVQLDEHGVTLTASSPGPWALTPMEAGRLRRALREALLDFDRLANSVSDGSLRARATRPTEPETPPERLPRQRVRFRPPARPSVAEIVGHAAISSAPRSDANREHQAHEHPGGNPMAA